MELVAATGLWKYRCDTLKREVMDQIKGMGDKMDWETYYPEERTPLDDVVAVGLLLIWRCIEMRRTRPGSLISMII